MLTSHAQCENVPTKMPIFLHLRSLYTLEIGAVVSEQISLQCNLQSAHPTQCNVLAGGENKTARIMLSRPLTSEYRGLIALHTHNSHQAATSHSISH